MAWKVGFLVLCAFLQVALAEFNQLFPPIKEGTDVGLVVVPGAFLTPDQYGEVGEYIFFFLQVTAIFT